MEKMKLSNENIAQASSLAEKTFGEWGVDARNILQIRLAVEETLLKYQEAFGAEAVFAQKYIKRLNRIRLELFLPGERVDPFDTGEEEQSQVLRGLLANMGVAPTWQYKNGENLILFTPKKKKPSQMASLALSVILALLCGGMFSFLQMRLSARYLTALWDFYQPLQDLWCFFQLYGEYTALGIWQLWAESEKG